MLKCNNGFFFFKFVANDFWAATATFCWKFNFRKIFEAYFGIIGTFSSVQPKVSLLSITGALFHKWLIFDAPNSTPGRNRDMRHWLFQRKFNFRQLLFEALLWYLIQKSCFNLLIGRSYIFHKLCCWIHGPISRK